jgi:UDP-N-acetylglucosamine 1-carboxyvinyltransferase
MSRNSFIIEGGKELAGEIMPGGNKNAVLPMIAAALLTHEPVTLENVPEILDVRTMLKILDELGANITEHGSKVSIDCCEIKHHELPRDLCSEVRASILFIAPLLLRIGKAKGYPPGGDVIGRRRLDAHFYGLRLLGAEVDEQNFVFSAPNGFKGKDLFFDELSVTATEHILLAAVAAKGVTIIRNAASEPHVQDLAKLLIKMGANIEGLNTNTLKITGVSTLHGTHHRIVSDHIEVAGYLALVAATGGEIIINNTVRSHYWMIQRIFQRFNIRLDFAENRVHLQPGQVPVIQHDSGGVIPRIDDGPWPQFPSDLMSAMLVLATQSEGTVLFFEKMFESRMYFVDKLIQMGASAIVCDPHRVVISGKTLLRSQTMSSPDIRAGMALIIAALCAKGTSTIQNASVIDRGYECMEKKLQSIGANITRN